MKPLSRVALVLLPPLAAVLLVGALAAPSLFTPATAEARSPAWPAIVQANDLPIVPARAADMIELEVRDVVPLEELGTHAVMLVSKDGNQVLPIFVSEEAAVSIAFRLAQRTPPHPLAADLMDGVLEKLGGNVTEIRIDDIKDEVFTGRVFIKQGKKNLELNARPSDAICMALGGEATARIFASQKVMTEGSISKDEIDEIRKQMPGVGGSGPEGGGLMPPNAPFHGQPAQNNGISL